MTFLVVMVHIFLALTYRNSKQKVVVTHLYIYMLVCEGIWFGVYLKSLAQMCRFYLFLSYLKGLISLGFFPPTPSTLTQEVCLYYCSCSLNIALSFYLLTLGPILNVPPDRDCVRSHKSNASCCLFVK